MQRHIFFKNVIRAPIFLIPPDRETCFNISGMGHPEFSKDPMVHILILKPKLLLSQAVYKIKRDHSREIFSLSSLHHYLIVLLNPFTHYCSKSKIHKFQIYSY